MCTSLTLYLSISGVHSLCEQEDTPSILSVSLSIPEICVVYLRFSLCESLSVSVCLSACLSAFLFVYPWSLPSVVSIVLEGYTFVMSVCLPVCPSLEYILYTLVSVCVCLSQSSSVYFWSTPLVGTKGCTLVPICLCLSIRQSVSVCRVGQDGTFSCIIIAFLS